MSSRFWPFSDKMEVWRKIIKEAVFQSISSPHTYYDYLISAIKPWFEIWSNENFSFFCSSYIRISWIEVTAILLKHQAYWTIKSNFTWRKVVIAFLKYFYSRTSLVMKITIKLKSLLYKTRLWLKLYDSGLYCGNNLLAWGWRFTGNYQVLDIIFEMVKLIKET